MACVFLGVLPLRAQHGDPVRGKAFFQQECVGCHRSSHVRGLFTPKPTLADGGADPLIRFVRGHIAGAEDLYSDADLGNLIAYLREGHEAAAPLFPRSRPNDSTFAGGDLKEPHPASFSFTSVGGGTIRTGDYRGRVVLVAAVFTACLDCQKIAALVQEMYRVLGPRGFQPLLIVMNGRERGKAFAADYSTVLGLTFPVGYGSSEGPDWTEFLEFIGYDPRAPVHFPQLVLIDPHGVMKYHSGRGLSRLEVEDLENDIRLLLAEATPPAAIPGRMTPPVVTYRIHPDYTAQAKAAGIEGTTALSFVISIEGRAENIRTVQSLDPDLDANAIECLRQWQFEPGMKDGKLVAVPTKVEFSFRLRSRRVEPAP